MEDAYSQQVFLTVDTRGGHVFLTATAAFTLEVSAVYQRCFLNSHCSLVSNFKLGHSFTCDEFSSCQSVLRCGMKFQLWDPLLKALVNTLAISIATSGTLLMSSLIRKIMSDFIILFIIYYLKLKPDFIKDRKSKEKTQHILYLMLPVFWKCEFAVFIDIFYVNRISLGFLWNQQFEDITTLSICNKCIYTVLS